MVSPAPVTAAERDSILAIGDPDGSRYSPSDIPWAEPIIRRLTVGDDGYIYVLPETLGRDAGSVVDVFTDAGVYLGEMEAPGISVGRGSPPPVVRDGHLYAVVRDELDVEYSGPLRHREAGRSMAARVRPSPRAEIMPRRVRAQNRVA